MILAEQQRWGFHQTEQKDKQTNSLSSYAVFLAIKDQVHEQYSRLRRATRKLSFKALHRNETPNILEFNAFALVKRYIEFRKTCKNSQEALDQFNNTVRSDIQTWVNEFLRKVEVDEFVITLDKKTGKLTNQAYEQFSDDLLDMMDANVAYLDQQGKDTTRAKADAASIHSMYAWASTAKKGDTSLSISPRYQESSEQLINDPYEFVFFREITDTNEDIVTITTRQYKAWLSYEDMTDILRLSGYESKKGNILSPEEIAAISHPLSADFTEHDLLLLLNSSSFSEQHQEAATLSPQNLDIYSHSVLVAEQFLVDVVSTMLSSLENKNTSLTQSEVSRVIEEAINFAMRYMTASKDQILLGKEHSVDLQQLYSSFMEYIELKYIHKKTSQQDSDRVMNNVSVSLGGMLGQMATATQCYGSVFTKISLNSSTFTAPNFQFAGLGHFRPDNALLLKEPMNCPFCQKKVLVWKHKNRIQCSWCGRFKECGSNESYGATYSPSYMRPKQKRNDKETSPTQEPLVEHKTQTRVLEGLWLFSFFAPRYILETS